MYKVLYLLDKFFLKYEVGSRWPLPLKKISSKNPALLGLTTPVTQPISFLRAILWKVVLCYVVMLKVVIFLIVALLFSKITFFRGSLNLCESIFWWSFFPHSNCCYDNWEIFFVSNSMEIIVRETNLFMKIMQLIHSNYPWKNGPKQIKNSQE